MDSSFCLVQKGFFLWDEADMKVGFIGPGKVGRSFGHYLKNNQTEIVGYFGKTHKSTIQLASEIGCTAISDLSELIDQSDLIGITVQDDQVAVVVDQILNLKKNLSNKTFFHMSGSLSVEVLNPLSTKVFSLHPLKAFPKVMMETDDFKGVYFSLEGGDASLKNWLSAINLTYFEISSHQKVQYHAAAAIVSNYLVAVLDFGFSQFEALGLPAELAKKALWPLVMGTIENVEILGTKKALTGPIVRGDVHTIEKHLEAMHDETKALYKTLGAYTLKMTNLPIQTQEKLSSLFKEE